MGGESRLEVVGCAWCFEQRGGDRAAAAASSRTNSSLAQSRGAVSRTPLAGQDRAGAGARGAPQQGSVVARPRRARLG